MAKDWIHREVGLGLAKLISLRLPGTPPEDVIPITVSTWAEAIAPRTANWTEERDVGRIRHAFVVIAQIYDRWPAPIALINNLPPPPQPRPLPQPPVTPEQKARNKARLKRMMAGFVQSKRI